jgi:hypothetical protein
VRGVWRSLNLGHSDGPITARDQVLSVFGLVLTCLAGSPSRCDLVVGSSRMARRQATIDVRTNEWPGGCPGP